MPLSRSFQCALINPSTAKYVAYLWNCFSSLYLSQTSSLWPESRTNIFYIYCFIICYEHTAILYYLSRRWGCRSWNAHQAKLDRAHAVRSFPLAEVHLRLFGWGLKFNENVTYRIRMGMHSGQVDDVQRQIISLQWNAVHCLVVLNCEIS